MPCNVLRKGSPTTRGRGFVAIYRQLILASVWKNSTTVTFHGAWQSRKPLAHMTSPPQAVVGLFSLRGL